MDGIAVMLGALYGDEGHTADLLRRAVGQTITDARLAGRDPDELRLTFADGLCVRVFDAGQSCCEHRYMTTDDDPSSLVGHRLVSLSVRDAANLPHEYAEHEVAFLVVSTDGGPDVTFATHNEHNGYYGGFLLKLDEAP